MSNTTKKARNNRKKESTPIRKYSVKKTSRPWIIATFIICLVLFLICLIIDNNYTLEVSSALAENGSKSEPSIFLTQFIPPVKEFLLILLSVLVSGFISGFIIDIEEKNDLFSDTVIKDVLASEYFCDKLNDEERETLLDNLEKRSYFDNSNTLQDMFGTIRKKLTSVDVPYYYKKCDFTISCRIKENCIKKRFSREIQICSLAEEKELRSFSFLTLSAGKMENGESPIERIRIYINGDEIGSDQFDVNKYDLKRNHQRDDSFHLKGGYTQRIEYVYKGVLKLSSDTPVRIKTEYTSVVPVTDKIYISRVNCPCKEFSLDYSIDESKDDYVLNVSAYGFIENGSQSIDWGNDLKNRVKITFNDWIFPGDGATIAMLPQNNP